VHNTGKLPEIDIYSPDFSFSQGSLQAYEDCPRLYQLRYLQRLPWPAPEVEPSLDNERTLLLGSAFHKMVQQFMVGIPVERLERLSHRDPELTKWWTNFTNLHPQLDGESKHHEITLSTQIGDFRLLAKYDLLILDKKRITIYDWKTNRKLIKRKWMTTKLQSRVYPFVLVKAGAGMNKGAAIDPEMVEMVYWFSNHPTSPIQLPYSSKRFQEDGEFIHGLISEIKSMVGSEFSRTENQKRCQFCIYRSLCNRGVSAGAFEDFEDIFNEGEDEPLTFDYEQITEIEF